MEEDIEPNWKKCVDFLLLLIMLMPIMGSMSLVASLALKEYPTLSPFGYIIYCITRK